MKSTPSKYGASSGHSSAKLGSAATSPRVMPWMWVNWKHANGGRISRVSLRATRPPRTCTRPTAHALLRYRFAVSKSIAVNDFE
ncbi:MAG: hypothetical protein IPG04_09535 [Polyangiaceae bacterium]|nr:hypothetical protein [Polyangiaceae bacterium]